MIHTVTLRCLVMALTLMAFATPDAEAQVAVEPAMERAITAFFGTAAEARSLWLAENRAQPNGKKHKFNIKRARIMNQNGVLYVSGRITHVVKLWDDQVDYAFVKHPDGRITDFSFRDSTKWWKKLGNGVLGKLGPLLRDEGPKLAIMAFASDNNPQQLGTEELALQQAIVSAEAQIGSGGWQKVVARIVANAAIRAKATGNVGAYDRLQAVKFRRQQFKASQKQ